MDKLSKSPQRHTFQKEKYIERCEEKGETPNDNYLDLFQKIIEDAEKKFNDPKSRENSLEYDLRSTQWICQKAKDSKSYAQNLYAAMCNNEFEKIQSATPEGVMNVLSDKIPKWSCSWRYAGGIVADMREEGDYIEWYCSGIRDVGYGQDEEMELNDEQPIRFEVTKKYVAESYVTDEIRVDLRNLGWEVIEYSGEE